jgi:hypothetical protein
VQGYCSSAPPDNDTFATDSVALQLRQCMLVVSFRLFIWPKIHEAGNNTVWLDKLYVKLQKGLPETQESQDLVRWSTTRNSHMWATRLALVDSVPSGMEVDSPPEARCKQRWCQECSA